MAAEVAEVDPVPVVRIEPRLRFHHQMAAGCGASVVAALVLTPLEVVKTRLQSQSSAPGRHNFAGPLDAFRKIAKHEGVRQLWRGTLPTLWASIPSVAVYMTSYEQLKFHIQNHSSAGLLPWVPAIAGATARSVSVTLTAPMELVRTRVQARVCSCGSCARKLPGTKSKSIGSWDVLRCAVRSNGLTSLWRGLNPTLMRDMPFSAFYWLGVEHVRTMMRLHGPTVEDPASRLLLHNLVAGSASGLGASIITHPFDVIKTRMQVQLLQPDNVHCDGVICTLRNLVLTEGYQGLFTGLIPRAIKAVPSCAIVLMSYEAIKRLLGERDP